MAHPKYGTHWAILIFEARLKAGTDLDTLNTAYEFLNGHIRSMELINNVGNRDYLDYLISARNELYELYRPVECKLIAEEVYKKLVGAESRGAKSEATEGRSVGAGPKKAKTRTKKRTRKVK
jgi:hypothetical protein